MRSVSWFRPFVCWLIKCMLALIKCMLAQPLRMVPRECTHSSLWQSSRIQCSACIDDYPCRKCYRRGTWHIMDAVSPFVFPVPLPAADRPCYPPTLRIVAVATMIRSILSDTTLVVTGTVLTLTLCLGGEDGSGPRRLVSSVLGVFGGSLLGSNSGEKEL